MSVISVSEVLFYGFYLTLTLVKWMGLYEGMQLYTVGVAAAFLFVIIKLVTDRYTVRRLVLSVLALALGAATWQLSDKMGAMFNITLVVAMAGINRERLLRVTAISWSVLFVLQVFLSMSGIRFAQIYKVHVKLGQYIVRWSMGFTHPNVLHITYYVWIAILMYVSRPQGRRLVRASVIAMAGNVLLFVYSLSYTGFLIVTFYLLLNLLMQRCHDRDIVATINSVDVCVNKIRTLLTVMFPILCIAFAVVGPLILRGRLFDLVNQALSTRYELSRQYLIGQGLSLFGAANMEVRDASITVDSSYVYMLVHHGIVYSILCAALLVMAVAYYMRRLDYWATAILLTCALSGITEQYMANTSFKNIAALFIGCMIWENLPSAEMVRDRTIAIPTWYTGLSNRIVMLWRSAWTRTWCYRMITILLAAFVAGTIAYIVVVPRPSAVYASPWDCDRPEGDAGNQYIYYHDLMADPEFDGWILTNRDSEGKLYEFDGFTSDYEYGRRALGMGITSSMVVGAMAMAVATYRYQKHSNLDEMPDRCV